MTSPITDTEKAQFNNLFDLLQEEGHVATMRCTLDGEDIAVIVRIEEQEDGSFHTYPCAILITDESKLFERIVPPEGGEPIR